MEIGNFVPSLIALVVGLIPAVLTYLIGQRQAAAGKVKAEADAAASLTQAASGLVDDLREEIEFLRKKIRDLEIQNQNQQEQLAILQETLDTALRRIGELLLLVLILV